MHLCKSQNQSSSMEALRTVSTAAMPLLLKAIMFKPISSLSFSHKNSKSLLINLTQFPKSKCTKFNAISPSDSTQPATQPAGPVLGPANPCRRPRPKISKGPKSLYKIVYIY
ncbi:hypothetical protein Hanom_Chr14g01268561 [Helianthus anomalus]